MARKDEGIDKLVEEDFPDPNSPDSRSMSGYALGRSEDPARYRLYLDSSLSRYIEFARDDVVHARTIGPERTIVWVKPGTSVRRIDRRTLPVEFLQGQIRTGFLRGAGNAMGQMLMSADCPRSGCGHCTASCSHLPGPGTTVEFTCNC